MNTELLLASLEKYGVKAFDILVKNEIRESYTVLGILSGLVLISVIVFLFFNKKYKDMLKNTNKYCFTEMDKAENSKDIAGAIALMFLLLLCILGPVYIHTIKYPEAAVIKSILMRR